MVVWPSLGIYCQCAQPLVFKSPASRTSALTLAEFLDALTVTGVIKKNTPTTGGVVRVKWIFPTVIYILSWIDYNYYPDIH